MFSYPLIVQAHPRLHPDGQPPSAPPNLCALRGLRVGIPPALGHQSHTSAEKPTRLLHSSPEARSPKSFRSNTYKNTGFVRFWRHLSSLEATLTRASTSVASKGFTEKLNPLDATLTKNRGEGAQLLLTRNPREISIPRNIVARALSSTGHGSRTTQRGLPLRIPNFQFQFSIFSIRGLLQYAIGPTSFSTSAVSTMTMASHGQPSRKQPSGPLLRHFLHPMHWRGSIWMRPNGGLSSSGTQNMQSSTGQYSTQAGDPAQPVQHSVITASSFGFFLRAVEMPFERGSNFWSSGTIPGALTTSGALAI